MTLHRLTTTHTVNHAVKQPTKKQTSLLKPAPINPTPAACELIYGNLPSTLPASYVSAPFSIEDDSNTAVIFYIYKYIYCTWH